MNVTIQKAVGGKLLTGGSTSPMAMSVPGSSSYNAPNDPSDVYRIQELLNLLAASRVAIPVTGRCGRETVDAITDFQKLYRGMPDGKVDPAGLTLARMNAVATALKLEEPKMTSPDHGAYVLTYTGTRPPEPYRVLLNVCPLQPAALVAGRPLVPEAQYCMEVTTRPSTGLLNKDNLGDFLQLVEKRGLWADNKAALRLIVVRDTQVISVSTPQQFKPPVKPWPKKVTPTELGHGDDGPKLKYIGTGESPFIGRYFYSRKIGDKYYWKYGAELVTEQQYRGFDCITFVGSLYLKDPAPGANNPFASSANMASALNATPVAWKSAELIEAERKEAAMTEAEKKKVAAMTEVEKKREAERKKKFAEENQVKDGEGKGAGIKKYFAQASGNTGTYLLWKGSHITLVISKKVHEFAHSKGGYSVTDVANWVGDSVDYHLYSLPADKQFQRMSFVRIACLTLLAGCAGALAAAEPLSSSNAGTWQFLPLPREWIEANWPKPRPEEAYIALRGPHPADLGKYAPCYEPPRLMVGVVKPGAAAREHLLACVHYCKSDDGPGGAAGGLWARETHLEGITAQILDNGTIEVLQHFRRLAEVAPAVERDVRVVNKLRFQDEPRIRRVRFTAANLAAAAAKRGDDSCLQR